MSTNARIIVSALALVALLTVAALGAIGQVEAVIIMALFVAWLTGTIMWVVMPLVRQRH